MSSRRGGPPPAGRATGPGPAATSADVGAIGPTSPPRAAQSAARADNAADRRSIATRPGRPAPARAGERPRVPAPGRAGRRDGRDSPASVVRRPAAIAPGPARHRATSRPASAASGRSRRALGRLPCSRGNRVGESAGTGPSRLAGVGSRRIQAPRRRDASIGPNRKSRGNASEEARARHRRPGLAVFQLPTIPSGPCNGPGPASRAGGRGRDDVSPHRGPPAGPGPR